MSNKCINARNKLRELVQAFEKNEIILQDLVQISEDLIRCIRDTSNRNESKLFETWLELEIFYAQTLEKRTFQLTSAQEVELSDILARLKKLTS